MSGSSATTNIKFDLLPLDNQRLVNFCGPVNQNIQQLEEYYGVKINCRSNQFEVSGDGRRLKKVKNTIQTLYNVAGHEALSLETVQLYLNDNVDDTTTKTSDEESDLNYQSSSRKRHGKN